MRVSDRHNGLPLRNPSSTAISKKWHNNDAWADMIGCDFYTPKPAARSPRKIYYPEG